MALTIQFYDNNAEQYAETTVNLDMSRTYDRFLQYLPLGASILDAGCGSGRDSRYFINRGYHVTMLDASAGMCQCAEELTGQKALCMKFAEIDFAERFDGIWACASLLHVPRMELEDVLARFHCALRSNGVLYASWKYGKEERLDGDRFYCDMTSAEIQLLLTRIGLFDCLECWISDDVLVMNKNQKWLNVILRKK